MIDLKVKILNPLIGDSIPLPEYSTEGSAGLDLRACVEDSFKLKPQECKLIPLGFSIYIEDPNAVCFGNSKIWSWLETWNCYGELSRIN
jgi:dUTP pyrophosphatase